MFELFACIGNAVSSLNLCTLEACCCSAAGVGISLECSQDVSNWLNVVAGRAYRGKVEIRVLIHKVIVIMCS